MPSKLDVLLLLQNESGLCGLHVEDPVAVTFCFFIDCTVGHKRSLSIWLRLKHYKMEIVGVILSTNQ